MSIFHVLICCLLCFNFPSDRLSNWGFRDISDWRGGFFINFRDTENYSFIDNENSNSLAGVAQWTQCRPVSQRVAGLVPSHGKPGLRARSPVGGVRETTVSHTLMFLFLSFFLLPPLKRKRKWQNVPLFSWLVWCKELSVVVKCQKSMSVRWPMSNGCVSTLRERTAWDGISQRVCG